MARFNNAQVRWTALGAIVVVLAAVEVLHILRLLLIPFAIIGIAVVVMHLRDRRR